MLLSKAMILVGALLLVTTYQMRIKHVRELTPHELDEHQAAVDALNRSSHSRTHVIKSPSAPGAQAAADADYAKLHKLHELAKQNLAQLQAMPESKRALMPGFAQSLQDAKTERDLLLDKMREAQPLEERIQAIKTSMKRKEATLAKVLQIQAQTQAKLQQLQFEAAEQAEQAESIMRFLSTKHAELASLGEQEVAKLRDAPIAGDKLLDQHDLEDQEVLAGALVKEDLNPGQNGKVEEDAADEARSKPYKPRRARPSFMEEEEALDAPQHSTSAEKVVDSSANARAWLGLPDDRKVLQLDPCDALEEVEPMAVATPGANSVAQDEQVAASSEALENQDLTPEEERPKRLNPKRRAREKAKEAAAADPAEKKKDQLTMLQQATKQWGASEKKVAKPVGHRAQLKMARYQGRGAADVVVFSDEEAEAGKQVAGKAKKLDQKSGMSAYSDC